MMHTPSGLYRTAVFSDLPKTRTKWLTLTLKPTVRVRTEKGSHQELQHPVHLVNLDLGSMGIVLICNTLMRLTHGWLGKMATLHISVSRSSGAPFPALRLIRTFTVSHFLGFCDLTWLLL